MLVFEILFVGFVLLTLGGETLLRGGIGLSKVLGFPPIVVALLVVSIGATVPELSIVLQAITHGAPDIAFASVVGANIFNLLLVLGLSALIRPIPAPPKVVFRDGGVMFAASLVLAGVATSGSVSRAAGVLLLAGFVLYFALSFVTDWRRPAPFSLAESRALVPNHTPTITTSGFLLVLGLACLYFGARYAVDSAAAVARICRLPQAFVGLTIVTVGVCVPLLFTTVAASARGVVNVVAGQLVGVNALNILFVMGLASLVRPFVVPAVISQAGAYVLAACSGLVVAMMLPGWRITRRQGAILLMCFVVYAVFLAWWAGFVVL